MVFYTFILSDFIPIGTSCWVNVNVEMEKINSFGNASIQ